MANLEHKAQVDLLERLDQEEKQVLQDHKGHLVKEVHQDPLETVVKLDLLGPLDLLAHLELEDLLVQEVKMVHLDHLDLVEKLDLLDHRVRCYNRRIIVNTNLVNFFFN